MEYLHTLLRLTHYINQLEIFPDSIILGEYHLVVSKNVALRCLSFLESVLIEDKFLISLSVNTDYKGVWKNE